MQMSNTLFKAGSERRGWYAGLLAFLLLFMLNVTGGLRPLEDRAQDALRRRLAKPLDPSIEMVYLDDVSLHQAEGYGFTFPWPRELYGKAVDTLRQAGAKVIVFDFLFTSHSGNRDDDIAFAKAMQRHGNVVIGMQFTAAEQKEAAGAFLAQEPLYQLKGGDPDARAAHGVDFPKPPLWGAAAAVGDTYFEQDPDGLGRRATLQVKFGDRSYPSLAMAAALAAGYKGEVPVRQQILFRQPVPADRISNLFDLAASADALAAGEKPLIDLAKFKDKAVFIGSSAPALADLRSTPIQKNRPGVELNAQIFDNLITGQSLEKDSAWRALWPIWLLLCLIVAGFSFRLRGLAVLLPLLATSAGGVALATWFYDAKSILIPVATPVIAALLAFAASATENFLLERSERKRVTSVFGQFLSPSVLSSLRITGTTLEMGGETRELTVFFSDLQGFTSFSEKLTPHALVQILNEYLSEMTELLVGSFDATVDKYIGDAIMCFWNAPTDQPDHALRACQAAWACQVQLGKIQDKLKDMGLDAGEEGLVMRIGLNTGPAIAGLMGSRRKLNYTVMGDTVNTASRLEGANKPYGSRILISAATKDAAGPTVLTRPLDYIKVKGKAEATPVFEIIGIKGEGKPLYSVDYVNTWTVALGDYKRGDFKEALKGFQACEQAQPGDEAAELFDERCQHYLHEPPKDWDGVYTMKTK